MAISPRKKTTKKKVTPRKRRGAYLKVEFLWKFRRYGCPLVYEDRIQSLLFNAVFKTINRNYIRGRYHPNAITTDTILERAMREYTNYLQETAWRRKQFNWVSYYDDVDDDINGYWDDGWYE